MTQAVMDMSIDSRAGAAAPATTRQVDIETLVMFARHLPVADRSLVQSVFERGLSPVTLAKSMEQSPATVRRRLRRVVKRMRSPQFRFVVRHMNDWPDVRRAVAQHAVLHGRSLRATARLLNLSTYRVRHEYECIRILCEAAG